MAIRNIVTEGDPILQKTCREVTLFDEKLAELLSDMTETMREQNGAGLAASQVGLLRRVAVVEVDDKVFELVNPIVTATGGKQSGPEGCLSFPGQYGLVTRANKVTVKCQDRNGKKVTYKGEGLLARAFLHEIDHLNGVVFTTHCEKMLTPQEVEEYYKDEE